MTRLTLTVAGAVLLLLPAVPLRADDAPAGDKDLDGVWMKVSALANGEAALAPPEIEGEVTIQGDLFTCKSQVGKQETKLKIDAAKTPKKIDMIGSKKDQGGRIWLGIYEVKGDELRICTGEPGKDRPTEFSGKEGTGWTLSVYKRVKK